MAYEDAIKTLGWLTVKPKKPKKQTADRVFRIEVAREKIAQNLQNWVKNGLQKKNEGDFAVTVIGETVTSVWLRYSQKSIGGKPHFIPSVDEEHVKQEVLKAASLVLSGGFDDEIRRIDEEAKAYRKKLVANKKMAKQ